MLVYVPWVNADSRSVPKMSLDGNLCGLDKHGKTVDFLLRRDRGIAAAQAFFRKALASSLPRVPRKVTLDRHVPSRRALWLLRREHPGFKSFVSATIAIAGIELAHRIRKGQFSFGRGRRRHGWSRKAEWAMALA
jgi:transposase-like protein